MTWLLPQILSSDGCSASLMLSTEFFSYFIHCILQLWNFQWWFFGFFFFNVFCIFVELHILFMFCFPDFTELSYWVFFIGPWASVKQLFWILSGKSVSIFRVLVTGKSLSFGNVMFSWFLMFLEVLHRCLCLWRSSHLFESLLTSGQKYLPSALLRILRLSQIFYGYTCSTLLVPPCVGICTILCLLVILPPRPGADSPLCAFPEVVLDAHICAFSQSCRTGLTLEYAC